MNVKKLGIRGRIMIASFLIFMLVAIPALFIIFNYMNSLVLEKVEEMDVSLIGNEIDTLDTLFSSLINAGAWISQDSDVKSAMALEPPVDREKMRMILSAQQKVQTYMASSPINPYINKAVIFNEDGIYFEYAHARSGNLADAEMLIREGRYREIAFPEGAIVSVMSGRTLNTPDEPAIISYSRMEDGSGWVYMEVSTSIFSGLAENDGTYIVTDSWIYPEAEDAEGYGQDYTKKVFPIPGADGISAVHYYRMNPMSIYSPYGAAMLIIVLIGAIIIALVLAILTAILITRPIERLKRHIERMSENEEYGIRNPEIEKGYDEISRIGSTINDMSYSIHTLLERNKGLYEEKKDTELRMLQMQVNPHFLYNTLTSISYLAELQKAEGITRMASGLTELLKSIAKGSDRHITLEEEMALVKDYDSIQQVRYLGLYVIEDRIPPSLRKYKIPQLTLQPIVENAIFHGIEPSGRCGTITVKACLANDGRDLSISVIDDGVGITDDEIAHIYDERKHSKTDMTGVGLRNIDERIRLVYGEGYGLSFRSEKGRFTEVMIMIKAERDGI